ncbi:hypothetical protein AB9128_31280, partial [Streptomyces cinereoruber]|uniref:hypothetical protein n=1 Tax=Streptomyces cinereoruber TaxID=67260 RepID=UPI003EB8DC43
DGYEIRTAAVARGVPCLTTVQALAAAVQGIDALRNLPGEVRSLQEHHRVVRRDEDRDQDPGAGVTHRVDLVDRVVLAPGSGHGALAAGLETALTLDPAPRFREEAVLGAR